MVRHRTVWISFTNKGSMAESTDSSPNSTASTQLSPFGELAVPGSTRKRSVAFDESSLNIDGDNYSWHSISF